jgi:hypothetical protein
MEFGMQNVGTDFRQVSKRRIIFLGHGSASCVCVGSNVLWNGRNLEDNDNWDHTEVTVFKFSTCINHTKFLEWKQQHLHVVWNQ